MGALIIGVVLFFGSVGYLAYIGIPFFLRRYSQAQTKKMEQSAKELDFLFVVREKKKLALIYIVTPLALGAIVFVISQNLIFMAAAIAVGLIVPKIITKNLSMLRRKKFKDQLVDALMVMSSSLKAGMSLNQSFEVLVEEMPSPICDEFSLVIKENKMGVSLEECLAHLRQRMPLDDLALITTAITVARETGGDLTEIFSQLVMTIREKTKLERRVRVLTVQGRLQGVIMMILPIAFAIFIFHASPENFKVLTDDPTGRMLLGISVVLEILGIFFIQKFSKIEV